MLADERPDVGLDGGERLRDPQLQVEITVVQRANGDRHRRALVLVRDRCEAGHGLDHDVTTRFSGAVPRRPSSSCS